jgi:hypothetical protein
MIEMVKHYDAQDDESHGNDMLKVLCDGKEFPEELVEMIAQAELRWAIAMANVYNEDGNQKH